MAVLAVILVATVFRVLPHWPNFTPLAAIALMSGAFIQSKRLALLVPILALFISDLVTLTWINMEWTSVSGFFGSPGTALIYLAFFLMTLIGFQLRKRQSSGALALSALSSSILFFLLSNFGVWMINNLPKDLSGLMQTYALGIPFFGYDLAGNIFYTFVGFGLIRVMVQQWPILREERING